MAGVSLFRISVRPNRLPRPCSGSGLTAWSGSCRQRSTGPRRLSSVSVFGQPIAKLDRSLRRCHGNGGDPLDMTITCLDATDLVYPPPVPARCPPARGVARSPVHAELTGTWRICWRSGGWVSPTKPSGVRWASSRRTCEWSLGALSSFEPTCKVREYGSIMVTSWKPHW